MYFIYNCNEAIQIELFTLRISKPSENLTKTNPLTPRNYGENYIHLPYLFKLKINTYEVRKQCILNEFDVYQLNFMAMITSVTCS